jgi:hypothetical protein
MPALTNAANTVLGYEWLQIADGTKTVLVEIKDGSCYFSFSASQPPPDASGHILSKNGTTFDVDEKP